MRSRFFKLKGVTAAILAFVTSVLAVTVVMPALSQQSSIPNFHLAAGTNASHIRLVSPQWLAEHLNDENLRVLDVRMNPLDYIQGHVPGAVHIADNTFRGPNGRLPIQYWNLDNLQFLFTQAGITANSDVVVYSDGNNLLGSTMVAYLLERSGHAKAAVLDGGYPGYRDAKLPLTKAFPQYEAGTFTMKDNPSVRVTLDDVRGFVQTGKVTFIDPRPAPLYAGEVDLFQRNGHIPGAKNIPWPTFTIGEDNLHKLKPLDEIQAILDRRGITRDDTIVVTCSTGREATLQYVVLKHLLNYPNVRIYEGSWTEYSSFPDLPLETGQDPDLV
ncbi:sulfurtransferase [Laspinema olomoucense]|nr:sulfurtransferase [Laspinema sp. D3d]MCT7974024.1 sulfurtransferase [Laspinema sp. D3d]